MADTLTIEDWGFERWRVSDAGEGRMARSVIVELSCANRAFYLLWRQDTRWPRHFTRGDYLDALAEATELLYANANPWPRDGDMPL